MEILDLYDENRQKIGKHIIRTNDTKLKNNEYFLYVQCWIVNTNKQILLTRRNFNIENAGKWEPTGGCVRSGETSIKAIIRELYEEIGIEVQQKDLTLIDTIKENNKFRNCFRDIFLMKKDFNLSLFNFNDKEVIDAKFVDIQTFEEMLNNKEIREYMSYFKKIYYKTIQSKEEYNMKDVVVDELGRTIIPRKIREQLNIQAGDKLKVSIDEYNRIILEKNN